MNLLIEVILLLLLVGIPSGLSTMMIGRSRQLTIGVKLLLIIGPLVDGFLAYLVFNWLGINGITLWVGTLSVALISHVLIQPLLVPQRLVVWRLAKENVLRRKRQAALLLAGLVIASAIITSSLVVGDSLDATITNEVEGAWGETDITLSGFDISTGERVVFSEIVANQVWQDIGQDDRLSKIILGQQQGVISGVSVQSLDGKSLPVVTWAAMNGTIDSAKIWPNIGDDNGIRFMELEEINRISSRPTIVINEVLADELEVKEGDAIEIGWYVTEDKKRKRVEELFNIYKIVENAGMANLAGTKSPALFSDLELAQQLQSLGNELNTVYYAVDSKHDDEGIIESVIQELGELLNNSLNAEDVGFELAYQASTNSLSISNDQGLGRIKGEDVAALKENISSLLPNSRMLEVLQVPLVEVEHQNQQILSLASKKVTALEQGNNSLWHFSDSGFGHQISGEGEIWLWQTKDGERINGFDLSSDGNYAGVAHTSGVLIADESNLNEEVWAELEFTGEMEDIVAVDDSWVSLEVFDKNLTLHEHSIDLSATKSHNLSINITSTVLNYDLLFDGNLFLEIEGLLNVERYVFNIENFNGSYNLWNEGDFWPQKVDENNTLHPYCDGGTSMVSVLLGNWCTYEEGILRYDDLEVETIRLPVVASAGGFGNLPQLFLAFGGDNSPLLVEEANVSVSQRLSALAMQPGVSQMWIKGLIPYAFGNDSALRLTHDGEYSELEGLESLSELDDVVLGFISLDYGERLAAAGVNERSILVLSGGEFNSTDSQVTERAINRLTEWFDAQSDSEDLNLQLNAVKVEAAKVAEESSGVISGMFLVFGTFTIAAGVLLVLTIVLMLAESRRAELGVLRAIGITKSDARALAVLEGVVIATIAGIVGALIGLVLAMAISAGFSSVFSSAGSELFTFSWRFSSLFAGWAWGFMLAMITLWGSALWTSRLNIVTALKGGLVRVQYGIPWPLILVQICTFAAAVISLLILLLLGLNSSLAYLLWTMGGVFMLVSVVPIITWQLPTILSKKGEKWRRWARHSSRNTFAWLGSSLLVWTILLSGIDPIRREMSPDELSFIVLGLVEVFAGVMVLTSAAPMLVSRLGRSRILTKRMGPTVPVALAHPLANPVRTAVVMAMFSITVFSVVVLSGYTEQFDNYSSSFVEESEGEFELMLTSSRSRPIELSNDADSWNVSSNLVDDIDAIGSVFRAEAFLEDLNQERMPYILRGFDEDFANHGGLPLYEWDERFGSTELEVWKTVGEREDLVLLDASFGLELSTEGTAISTISFSIGNSISLIDISNPGNSRKVTVAGFLEQSSYLFSPGVWLSDDVVQDQFDGRLTRMYVSLSDSAQASPGFDASEINTFSPTGKPENVRIAAAELSEILQDEVHGEGVSISVISDDVLLIQALVIAILGIFEAYLALGLIVGIAGIGVVTVRSVSERRKTVGVLRALGYRKKMVMFSFLIEVSWVALLGIMNGVLVAIGFHRALFVVFWESQGGVFTLPWSTILSVILGGWILVLLATAVPISRAARIPPSAALRDL